MHKYNVTKEKNPIFNSRFLFFLIFSARNITKLNHRESVLIEEYGKFSYTEVESSAQG